MKPPEQSSLLKEILTGDEVANFRQASLEQGLNALRQQQRRRRSVRIGMVCLMPLIFGLVFLSRRNPESSSPQSAAIKPMATVRPTPPAGSQTTKLITDEELFALFPNRPLALVGKPGQQQLVFLDRSSISRKP